MIDLDIMQDCSEVVHYDRPGVPLYIRTAKLSAYPNMRALCHWHDDLEWIYILSGRMNYYINGKKILLKENDSIMINARQMHYGYDFCRQECEFLCILFHPSLFMGNRVLQREYVAPVLENPNLEYLHFHSEEAFGRETAVFLESLAALKERAEDAYEIEAVGRIHLFWSTMLRRKEELDADIGENICWDPHTDLKVQKDMVSYIYQHYGEKITLEDIAASGHVCRSKCCSIFKHYLQQSPIEFLNAYRLKVSCNLLRDTQKSITEIAFSCGFNHLSYFSKMFLGSYGCTPREYRRKNME